jgi:arylsulfatase A-like enzyme
VAHSCDWLPTLAELCGVALPKSNLNGRSLVSVLRSAAARSPHDTLVWKVGSQWAVREGDWKLLHDPIDPATAAKPKLFKQHWFLANVTHDPGERANAAAEHPDILAHLRQIAASADLH